MEKAISIRNKGRLVALVVLFLLCTGCSVTQYAAIKITSSPSGAAIDDSGHTTTQIYVYRCHSTMEWESAYTRCKYERATETFTVKKEGYHPITKSIEIRYPYKTRNEALANPYLLHYDLRKIGRYTKDVEILSSPEGAHIYNSRDNSYWGQTPVSKRLVCDDFDNMGGRGWTIRVEKTGYQTKEYFIKCPIKSSTHHVTLQPGSYKAR